MQFALLGDSRGVLPFARSVRASAAHSLDSTVLAPSNHAILAREAPGLAALGDWRELLGPGSALAVIVASDDEAASEALRALAAAGKHLFVYPTRVLATSWLYELSVLQNEIDVEPRPLFWRRCHPFTPALRNLAARSLGPLRHARLDATLVAGETNPDSQGLSSAQVAEAFLQDVDFLRQICGDYNQVSAVVTGLAAAGVSRMSMTLDGPSSPQIVWTVESGRAPSWKFVLTGGQGTATLSGDPDRGTLTLETEISGQPPVREVLAESVFDRLLSVVAPAEVVLSQASSRQPARGENPPGWNDLLCAGELLDAAEQSLRRRRTIEVHHELPSERSAFKTQMTAGGCSLLVLTLAAVVVYLVAAAAIPLTPVIQRILVALIFAPLGLFLVMQIFVFVARPARQSRAPAPPDPPQGM